MNQVLSLMGRALFGSLRHSRLAFIFFTAVIVVNIFIGIIMILNILVTQEDSGCFTSSEQPRAGQQCNFVAFETFTSGRFGGGGLGLGGAGCEIGEEKKRR